MATTDGAVDVARLRWWLTNLARPERLGDPHMSALLRAHGRATKGSPLEVGSAGARLLTQAIEGLSTTGLPHRVLHTCFVEGVKSRGAAARLGLSERQLSRERTRALTLLAAHLAPAHERVSCGSPPPLPEPYLARPAVARSLAEALQAHRRVAVAGPPGCGKTTLVAAHAAASPARTFWYRGAPGLPALLFDLGDYLEPDDPSLASYVRSALPELDVGLATRIAIAGLSGRERLLVFDGADAVEGAVDAFLDEALARLPLLAVVTTGMRAATGPQVTVPPFDPGETRALLDLAGVSVEGAVATGLHAWTGGNARLVAAAASWLAGGDSRGRLEDSLRRRSAGVTALRGMTGAARRAAPVRLSA